MNYSENIKVMILASYYCAEHVARIKPYHRMNKAASRWNTTLFNELRKLPVEMHIVQFYPVLKMQIIKEGNVTYYYIPRVPKIDGFTSIIKKWRVKRLARKIRPDIIHGIGSEHGHAWPAIHKDKPSVITIHGYLKNINRLAGHKSLLKRLFLEREESKALLEATTIIAINGYMKDVFIKEGVLEKNIRIAHNPLDPLYLTRCTNIERDIDILMVGTLHPLKNIHVALEIFAQIKNEHGITPSVIIAGAPTVVSQSYYNKLLEFKRRHNLDNVRFEGSVDQASLKNLYCRSKILLHISEFETDSMVVSEAFACGVLPVVNPVAALAFRVNNGENGYYADIRHPEQVVIMLVDILEHYDKAKILIDNGRHKTIQERNPENVANVTLNAYHSTLAQGVDRW
ncbi:MAG: glycosyltransferase family 4 protein [Candidatus Heimdallarchaeota archaeon]|nr:glycosyltransferase family 4 protein [Candidatus Heimdallarchaeota archaeon]